VCADNTRLALQCALLLASVSLTACGGGGKTKAPATAAISTPVPVITSVGTDFYLTLPDNLCVSSPASCNSPVSNKLIVAAATATSGNVAFNGVTTPFSVSAGGETEITLDPAVVLTSNETVEAKGIHVTAISPVSLHVVSESATSADGYLALPTAGLGTDYYVMSYASPGFPSFSTPGSEFAIVATQDSTTVTITPTAAGVSKPAGTTYTVLLNIGETYQLTNPAFGDMTGTHVTADKPIGVFGGHRCAAIPSGAGYCDYLVEQLPDVSIWGKTFHTSPFSGRARYTVRIIASQDGTTFTTIPSGLISGTLNAGQFADVILSGAGEFVSSSPVQVAQFMHGYKDEAVATQGDPSMVLVTPAEMGMTDATFGVHGLTGTSGAFMNVVAETAALANMKLDNSVVDPALFKTLGGTSIYSVGTIPVAAGAHSLSGTAPFSALVYDYGTSWNDVSYAYPVAAKLSLPVAPTVNPASSGCGTHLQDEDRYSAVALEHANQTRQTTQTYREDEDDDSHECDE